MIDPKYLKFSTVSSLWPFILISLWKPFGLFVITLVFSGPISILYLVVVVSRRSTRTSVSSSSAGERGGSVVECRTPEREVRGSRPTAAVLCPWARHFTPRKYWLITQEAMAPSRHDWKIVDWDVKPQHNQPTKSSSAFTIMSSAKRC